MIYQIGRNVALDLSQIRLRKLAHEKLALFVVVFAKNYEIFQIYSNEKFTTTVTTGSSSILAAVIRRIGTYYSPSTIILPCFLTEAILRSKPCLSALQRPSKNFCFLNGLVGCVDYVVLERISNPQTCSSKKKQWILMGFEALLVWP